LRVTIRPQKKKLTWLADYNNRADLTPIILHEYFPLITKETLQKDDVFEEHINPIIHKAVKALGDQNLRLMEKGKSLQLERTGYFIVDKALLGSHPLELVNIPDGRITDVYKKGDKKEKDEDHKEEKKDEKRKSNKQQKAPTPKK